jgi:hypothetical protein
MVEKRLCSFSYRWALEIDLGDNSHTSVLNLGRYPHQRQMLSNVAPIPSATALL